jgi:hypothetical protein
MFRLTKDARRRVTRDVYAGPMYVSGATVRTTPKSHRSLSVRGESPSTAQGGLSLTQADSPQGRLGITADGNPADARNRRYSATASSARFARSEQASISLIEKRAECIEASLDGLDGFGADHSARLDTAPPDSLQLSGLVRCVFVRRGIRSLRLACFGSAPKLRVLT